MVSDHQDPWPLARAAADELGERFGVPDLLVVAGSGWADAVASLGEQLLEVSAHEVAGVPEPTVVGHEGRLRLVRVGGAGGAGVLVVSGRSHLYEGHTAATVVHLVRAAVLAGVRTVVLTNAAGSLRAEVGPGRVVLLSDHLNLTGTDAMAGPAPPHDLGSRFADLTRLYDPAARAGLLARRPDLVEGVYAGLRGASFETPAEIRMLRTLGADLVGMSTVLEAVAAHHLGARVVGLSLVTNLAAGMQERVAHDEVLEVAARSTGALTEVLADVVAVTTER